MRFQLITDRLTDNNFRSVRIRELESIISKNESMFDYNYLKSISEKLAASHKTARAIVSLWVTLFTILVCVYYAGITIQTGLISVQRSPLIRDIIVLAIVGLQLIGYFSMIYIDYLDDAYIAYVKSKCKIDDEVRVLLIAKPDILPVIDFSEFAICQNTVDISNIDGLNRVRRSFFQRFSIVLLVSVLFIAGIYIFIICDIIVNPSKPYWLSYLTAFCAIMMFLANRSYTRLLNFKLDQRGD